MKPPVPTYPAATLRTVYAACNPDEPLKPGDPRCIDLTEARGGVRLAARIASSISWTAPGSYHRQLITGHRGCGKSTEILQLQATLRDEGFHAVYVDAADVLDPADIEHVDVLLAIAQAVYADVSATGIALDRVLLASLENWFHETVITSEERADLEASLKGEAKAEGGLFLKMMVAITGQLKASNTRRREIRQKLEREM